VVGVFNCQGAGWCRVTKRTRVHDAAPGTLTGTVRADDVDAIARVAGAGDDGDGEWDGEAVVYAHRARELVRLPRGAALPVTLGPLQYEVFHVCPLRAAAPGVGLPHHGRGLCHLAPLLPARAASPLCQSLRAAAVRERERGPPLKWHG